MLPEFSIVPPITSEFISFETGKLSPVIIDSSTEQFPQTTLPSIGILSPLLTTKTSFFLISLKSISTIFSSTIFFADVF